MRYGDDPEVHARVREYCGATRTDPPSAAYVATLRGSDDPFLTWGSVSRHPTSEIVSLLHAGGELSRSLWDTRHLVFLIDVDHQNPDDPGQPFVHPADVFVRLEPTYRAVRHVLSTDGIAALPVMTGRGYHFVGTVGLDHPIVDRLAGLRAKVPDWHATHERRCVPGIDARLTERHARAVDGLGLLIEYVAHRVARRAASSSAIPITMNGTPVGNGAYGRECVSLDFSHVGDPLDIRHFRVAFGPYQWHRARPDIFGADAGQTPDLIALPRGRRNLLAMLLGARTPGFAQRLAGRSHARIPDIALGVGRLLDRYASSRLGRFHRAFDDPSGTTALPALDRASMPPCVSPALDLPNDLLLKPEHIQHLTRWLVSRGWRARQVAELVCAMYQEDHAWGARWAEGGARTRAEFDVRVFGGMIATGLDTMIDFNCVSAQEKHICPGVGCPHDLRVDRERGLLAKVGR